MARIAFGKVAPEAYRTVLALSDYAGAHLDHTLYELVKIRASMLNGCAYCVDMHSTDLLAAGEDVRRVVALSAWRESTFFTDEERAALALTDEVTRLGEHGVGDQVWGEATKHFDDRQLADLVVAIASINVWNRIAVTSRAEAPPLAARA